MRRRMHASRAGQRVRGRSITLTRRRRKPTWGIRAFYSRVNAATRRDWRRFRLTLRPGLERDTSLMPWLIAETVCGEVACFLDVEIPARYAAWIEARAEVCYAKPGHFRKLMRGPGNAPRDWLRAFMRHWLAALLGLERPDLYECLPDSFALGHSLPPPAASAPPVARQRQAAARPVRLESGAGLAPPTLALARHPASGPDGGGAADAAERRHRHRRAD